MQDKLTWHLSTHSVDAPLQAVMCLNWRVFTVRIAFRHEDIGVGLANRQRCQTGVNTCEVPIIKHIQTICTICTTMFT